MKNSCQGTGSQLHAKEARRSKRQIIPGRWKECVASLVAQMVRNLPAMWETCVRSLDQEDPLEKELATHSSVLVWRIPWTEEPGGPWGGKESGTTERLPDETVTCSWGERATRHAFSCVLREVTIDPSPSFLPLFTFGCAGSPLPPTGVLELL